MKQEIVQREAGLFALADQLEHRLLHQMRGREHDLEKLRRAIQLQKMENYIC